MWNWLRAGAGLGLDSEKAPVEFPAGGPCEAVAGSDDFLKFGVKGMFGRHGMVAVQPSACPGVSRPLC